MIRIVNRQGRSASPASCDHRDPWVIKKCSLPLDGQYSEPKRIIFVDSCGRCGSVKPSSLGLGGWFHSEMSLLNHARAVFSQRISLSPHQKEHFPALAIRQKR